MKSVGTTRWGRWALSVALSGGVCSVGGSRCFPAGFFPLKDSSGFKMGQKDATKRGPQVQWSMFPFAKPFFFKCKRNF